MDTNALQVNAYHADGSSEAEVVDLTADSAIFVTNSGLASSTTVTTANSAPLQLNNGAAASSVTVTATPVGNVDLAAKLTFVFKPSGPVGSHCKMLTPYEVSKFEIKGPGPVESVPLRGLPGQDGRSVLWAPNEDFVHATHYVTMTGRGNGAVPLMSDVEIFDVGLRNLEIAVREHPIAYVSARDGRSHVRFLGPSLLLQLRTRQEESGMRSPVLMSFPLARGIDSSLYHILHLAPGAKAWVEVTSVRDRVDSEVVLRASVSEHGTYALAASIE